MKLALIAALKLDRAYQTALDPLTFGYLAAYLSAWSDVLSSEPGGDVEIVVCREPAGVIAAKPDIIGLSSVSENYPIAISWAQQFRIALGVPVILGGPHISVLPRTLHEAFDAAVIGEGEETLVELLPALARGASGRANLSAIKGIAYREKGEIVLTPPRGLIRPLERIPHPTRGLLPGNRPQYLLTSRGCPYRCSFCASASLWSAYRAFPPEYVADEIEEIRRDFVQSYIHIFDDLFIANVERLRAIQEIVTGRGLHEGVTFGCHVRANIMSEDLCDILRKMNILSAGFGAESGSPRLLQSVKGGTATVEQNQLTIDLCYSKGIKISGSFMIGVPGETPEDLRLTREFILRNRGKLDAIEVALFCPYPGTPAWDAALERGIVSLDMDWNRLESHPFFCEMEIRDDYPYMGDVIHWSEFGKYIEEFKSIEREINQRWLRTFDRMES
jgi:radical SAM superfamily enzyme YgiQ (UPF0313 family)